MKNLYLNLLFIVTTILACSGDCTDRKCKNDGICVNNECECTFEYTGDRCTKEVRSDYTGLYRFILYVPLVPPDTTNIYITKDGSDAKRMNVGDYKVELTSATTYILPSQVVNSVVTTGNGTFIEGGFEGEITVEIGPFPVTSTYVGEKL